ncbi:MAG: hypothetical protein ICV79_19790, partial [Flavisolibacter sp.]|nr:hypothetical protein [Flavisolibacter sp.]
KEGEQELLSLERRQNYSILRDRMRFLRLLKSGECPSQAKAGGQIGLGLRGSEKLWKKTAGKASRGCSPILIRGQRESSQKNKSSSFSRSFKEMTPQRFSRSATMWSKSLASAIRCLGWITSLSL